MEAARADGDATRAEASRAGAALNRPRGAAALVEALRPRQWTKNVFVLAGTVFAGRMFDRTSLLRTAAAFAVFCAAASACYLVNDVADAAQDAHHPVKRNRPIASGRLSPAAALAAAAALGAVAIAAAFALPGGFLALVVAYLALTLAYSLGLKKLWLVDAMIVAAGFVLRAAAGAAAIDAAISPWLLSCSFELALFLSLGKRRSELSLLGEGAAAHRGSLSRYSLPLLDSWLTSLTGATIVTYALYTQAPRTVAHFGTGNLLFTVPFVVYALFRYQHLVSQDGQGGDPGTLLLRDRGLFVALVAWAVAAAVIIYR